ncbi:MAG TPA: 4-(cytidine 5'-diphospho)-2-C-methyl-D-erythritol kinase [Bacteroidales bacterium]|nr:4-(cytidine 5'-diphospho)-2-C-methyl-D-erythritol kinase [Bacteroidales bacterium]
MISFPNAKINLGLYITGKRTDGFHTIETVMLPCGPSDILEFVESDHDQLDTTGLETGAGSTDNLVMRTLDLLRLNFDIPPLHVHLHKSIPTGAGLGGGSSDAAFMLKTLNDHFSLGLNTEKLELYAARLGSDCTFFISNRPALATGRGEILTPVQTGSNNLHIVLLNPGLHVSTKEAYAGVVPAPPGEDIIATLSRPVTDWKNRLENQFEKTVFIIHPQIATLKKLLYAAGAAYASMSGSGSSVFGLFPGVPVLDNLPGEMIIYSGELL